MKFNIVRKALALFLSVTIFSTMHAAINWRHTVYNGTEGTIEVKFDSAVGTRGTIFVKPFTEGAFESGIYCITQLYVRGIAEPVQNLKGEIRVLDHSSNVCTWHSYTVTHANYETFPKTPMASSQNVYIGGMGAPLPDTANSYLISNLGKKGGNLSIEMTR